MRVGITGSSTGLQGKLTGQETASPSRQPLFAHGLEPEEENGRVAMTGELITFWKSFDSVDV